MISATQALPAVEARLGELAAEQGTTIRDLGEILAASAPTRAELAARAEQARVELRKRFGIEVTAEDEAAGHRLWDRISASTDRKARV